MKEKELLEAAMTAMRAKAGESACRDLYLIFVAVTEWLVQEGWGSVTLSAIDHRFSTKIRASTIREVKRKSSHH